MHAEHIEIATANDNTEEKITIKVLTGIGHGVLIFIEENIIDK